MLPLWKTQIICNFWRALSCSFNCNTGLDFSPHLLNIAAFSSLRLTCSPLWGHLSLESGKVAGKLRDTPAQGLGRGTSDLGLVEPPTGPGPQFPLPKVNGLACDEWFSSTFQNKATFPRRCLAERQLGEADRGVHQGAALREQSSPPGWGGALAACQGPWGPFRLVYSEEMSRPTP